MKSKQVIACDTVRITHNAICSCTARNSANLHVWFRCHDFVVYPKFCHLKDVRTSFTFVERISFLWGICYTSKDKTVIYPKFCHLKDVRTSFIFVERISFFGGICYTSKDKTVIYPKFCHLKDVRTSFIFNKRIFGFYTLEDKPKENVKKSVVLQPCR